MGCYDSFNFEKDFSFQNCKDDFVIIPRGVYQTKDLKSILDTLEINENFEINRPIWKSIEHKEFPKLDSRHWETKRLDIQRKNIQEK